MKPNIYEIGDKVVCNDYHDLISSALFVSSLGYGIAIIGFNDIAEYTFTIINLPDRRQNVKNN